MRPRQLALALQFQMSFAREDFLLSTSNTEAFSQVMDWPISPSRSLALVGPKGSGKSHLAAIWAEQMGARRVRAKELDTTQLRAHLATGALVLEDASAKDAQTPLFHLLNLVREEEAFLLLTAQTPPSQWDVPLKDLASRLRAMPLATLHAPDEALLKAVYVKLFADRQMNVDTGVIDYLMQHTTRTLSHAQKIVGQLDQLSLEKGRKITKLLVNEVIAPHENTTAP